MTAPRRWVNDPDADEALRELLASAPQARPLDQLTRRRLGAKVARASALPAAAAGWLFVKSAAAALGVVLGTGAIAVSTGIVDWAPRESAPADAKPSAVAARKPTAVSEPARVILPEPERTEPASAEPPVALNPSPSLPAEPATSAPSSLSAEAALLEQARREMRSAPSLALSRAAEHAKRFPRGQLASERTLIQIEALHRLGRDAEARSLARGLANGSSGGLYLERAERLLGKGLTP